MADINQRIADIKAAGGRVFSAKIAGVETIYRSLNRKEFRDIQKSIADKTDALKKASPDGALTDNQMTITKDDGEEHIVFKGLLVPILSTALDLSTVPAGFVSAVAELIMSASGFGEEVTPKEL